MNRGEIGQYQIRYKVQLTEIGFKVTDWSPVFTYDIVDPCETITVNHIVASPFSDVTYTLGDSLHTSTWDQTIATLDPPTDSNIDCGLFSIKLVMSTDSGATWTVFPLSMIVEDLDNQTVEFPNNYDLSNVGIFNFAYIVYLKDYPDRITDVL